jgi:ATP/maltotriose-dependent transcriptional regulator MalT
LSEHGGILEGVAARVTSPVLVGRADQLTTLDDALERARRGGPAAVLVGGEAGVGKSRLLTEFSARARGAGARVLTGRCLELAHGGLPFAPFTTVLRELVRDLGTDGVGALLAGQGTRELARLLPELGGPEGGAGAEADLGEARARLFEQILSLLGALAEPGPVLLVIEDLHWADRSSRDLLAFLVSNQGVSGGLLVVASYRSDELHRSHPLRQLLAELDRIDWVERAELPRLSRRNCAELVARILGREPEASLADQVYERTEGNPLFVEALLSRDGGLSRGLPESLHDLLAGSVQRLPEGTQDVLRVASAGGERAGHALLAAVTGLGHDELAAALRPAVAGNVLVTDADGYAFRHALIREVVYEDLLPGEHSRLHTRFAEAIGADPSLVAPGRAAIERAHHTYAAHDTTGALVTAWHAAHQAGRGLAQAEQLTLLSRVLELWDKVPDAARRIGTDRAGVLEEAVQAAWDGWENERGIALASAALKEVDVAAEPIRAALLLEKRGNWRHYHGRQDGLTDLRRALELVPALPPSTARARVLNSVADVLKESRPDEALAAARESVAVARQVGDAEVETQALMHVVGIEADRGTGEAGQVLEMLTQARGSAEQAGYRTLARVAIYESHVLEGMGEHDRAAEVARGGIARARDHGFARTDGTVLSINLAEPLVSLGRWDEADEVIEHALDLAPPSSLRGALLVLAGDMALARGDALAAEDSARTAAAFMSGLAYEAEQQLPLVRLQVQLRAAEGRFEQALSVIAEALDRFEVLHGPRYAWPVLVAGARACGAAGLAGAATRNQALAEQAAAQLARLRALAEKMAVPGRVQQAHRLTFTAEAARADASTSARPGAGQARAPSLAAWDAAAAVWELASQPYERAAALLRAAEVAVADGDREGGGARLLEAAALADRLGARPLIEEIRLLARRARIALTPPGGRPGETGTGRPTSGATVGEPGAQGPRGDRLGLTDREFEVLRLVAAGKSNREIAAELFISAKTASVHVSNILAKLGVPSRGEAAAAAHRLHLLDAGPEPRPR